MTIYFGLELDDLVYPVSDETNGGTHYFGPMGLLFMLESHMGLIGHPSDNEYLRIEQYRQLLRKYLEENANAFYKASFEVDQFATATEILERRDELLLAGWDFSNNDSTPERLQVISNIEKQIHENNSLLYPGYADRFIAILNYLGTRQHPIKKLFHNEPFELLPKHIQKLFSTFVKSGITVNPISAKETKGSTDLHRFRKFIFGPDGPKEKIKAQQDGSLLLLKTKRETDAATFLAQLFNKNRKYRPLVLVPEKNRALDNALIQESVPSLGILSASLARPSLQILKLIPTFLWQPIDPYKILEFVSLSVKPLADDLARLIANQMAQSPGMKSDNWYGMITRYFETLKERALSDKTINYQQIRNQYEFWFERTRYDISDKVPKEEVIEIFDYLSEWAFKVYDESAQNNSNGNENKNNSMLVLSQQAKKVTELLHALPDSETELNYLELERIVRTIYQPSPVEFKAREKGHLPHIHKTSNIIGSTQKLLWWNFVDREPDHFFSKWYKNELSYLESLNIHLTGPIEKNQLQIWQKKRPFVHTQEGIFLIMPQMVEGQEVQVHPLYGDLEACFDDLETISFSLDNDATKQQLENYFRVPDQSSISHHQLGQPKAMLQIKEAAQLHHNEEETFTSLDNLFYYPYQWAFRYKSKLRKSSILSVVNDVTLMGNLAHRFFELIFQQDVHEWNKSDVEKWINSKAYTLLSREGAVLLMYGREPERLAFINKIKYAAWSLLHMIQNNGWSVIGTEQDLEGKFMNISIKAKADLVLKRGSEYAVVDLKWRGAARRERIIKSEEDLQLVMYAKLLTEDHTWAHTAYFIIEAGKMVTRNNLAFKEAIAINPDCDHIEINQRIWDKMEATFLWRLQQLQNGNIEIRTKSTSNELEEIYEGQLMELLEMRNEDAPFDDYRTLINLIQ